MKLKSLIVTLLLSLITSSSFGFGLWGSADMGFGGSSTKPLLAATIAYRDRVVADGGTVIDLVSVNTAIKMLTDNSVIGNVKVAVAADWGVKKDGSNNVSKLYSLGGVAFDLIQATGANQPLWSAAGQNGKPIITFNGTSHFLKAVAFTLAQPINVFMTFNPITWTSADGFYDGNGINTMGFYQEVSTPLTSMFANSSQIAQSIPGLTLATWHQTSHKWGANNYQYRIDAVTKTIAGSANTTSAGGFILGARSGATNSSNIVFGEVIILDAFAATPTSIEAYQKTKWDTP